MNKLRLCREPDCWNYFKPRNHCHIYCGSAKLKIGCAYKNRLRLNSVWNKRNPEVLRRLNRAFYQRHLDRLRAMKRTKEYHFKVKLYKYNRYKREQLGHKVKWLK